MVAYVRCQHACRDMFGHRGLRMLWEHTPSRLLRHENRRVCTSRSSAIDSGSAYVLQVVADTPVVLLCSAWMLACVN